MPTVWAIVVAAGEGRRFGAKKQFELIAGRSVLEWSIDAARSVAGGVVVVLPAEDAADPLFAPLADVCVPGGATRTESVRAGLAEVPATTEVVIVHDAARPLASAALFAAVVEALADGADGVIPALAISDTVKRVQDGIVIETLDRNELVGVQTPQAFRAEALRAAHAEGAEGTDDASLLERLGRRVRVVEGEVGNLKLTAPQDLDRIRTMLAERPS